MNDAKRTCVHVLGHAQIPDTALCQQLGWHRRAAFGRQGCVVTSSPFHHLFSLPWEQWPFLLACFGRMVALTQPKITGLKSACALHVEKWYFPASRRSEGQWKMYTFHHFQWASGESAWASLYELSYILHWSWAPHWSFCFCLLHRTGKQRRTTTLQIHLFFLCPLNFKKKALKEPNKKRHPTLNFSFAVL